jgi:hypothetical protein
MRTRRSDVRPTRTAASGTPKATPTMASQPRLRSLVKNGSPVNGMRATSGRRSQKAAKAAVTPATAASAASTEAMMFTWRGVAPTRRSAAKRSWRRAAASRVEVATNTSTGMSSPKVPMPRTSLKKPL